MECSWGKISPKQPVDKSKLSLLLTAVKESTSPQSYKHLRVRRAKEIYLLRF